VGFIYQLRAAKAAHKFTTIYMADAFDRSKPHMNVGTIGHVDHGKTTLTAGNPPHVLDLTQG
jgi:GTPase